LATTLVATVTGSMPKPVQIQETWNRTTAPATGTLVLYGADTLDRQEQQDLLAWLDLTHGTVQVVSVSTRPIFPLVTQGLFLDTLYYRLNMMLVGATPDAE
jgi:DNA-binding NtrC family response regulator